MEKWQERFVEDARYALDNLQIVEVKEHSLIAQVSGRGRYVVYSVDSASAREGADKLIVVRWPWKAMYEQAPGLYTTPDYFIERFGSARGYRLQDYNGGDIYALLQCLHLINAASFPIPEELF